MTAIPFWKKALFCALALLPFYVALEVSSWLLLEHYVPSRTKARLNYVEPEDYIAAAKKARKAAAKSVKIISAGTADKASRDAGLIMFHKDLGWDFPPGVKYTDSDGVLYTHGPDGERRTCTSYDKTLIASFGDSFTYCAQVGDQSTWQTYLARDIESNVLNYGVGGYGTDQAYLKYLSRAAGLQAPIVTLGILPENINRVVNNYRTFYSFNDPLGLTKPRFNASGGAVTPAPNPLRSSADVRKLNDPAFVARLGRDDFWYQLGLRAPRLGFPYTVSLWRWRHTALTGIREALARNLPPGTVEPVFSNNLYDDPQSLAIMTHVVDRFVETAKLNGAKPLVLIMPHADYVTEVMETGACRVDPLISHLKLKNCEYVDLIRMMAALDPDEKTLEKWFIGHAGPEGNKVVAELIALRLHEKGLAVSKSYRRLRTQSAPSGGGAK